MAAVAASLTVTFGLTERLTWLSRLPTGEIISFTDPSTPPAYYSSFHCSLDKFLCPHASRIAVAGMISHVRFGVGLNAWKESISTYLWNVVAVAIAEQWTGRVKVVLKFDIFRHEWIMVEEESGSEWRAYIEKARFGEAEGGGGVYVRERSCVICCDEFSVGSEISKLPCSHVFHGDCLDRWLTERQICPLCRYQIPDEVAVM